MSGGSAAFTAHSTLRHEHAVDAPRPTVTAPDRARRRARRALSKVVAVVGVGETDYPQDYHNARARERGEPVAAPPPTNYDLAVRAFRRALDDSGLHKDDIDGLAVSNVATSIEFERVGELLGLSVRWGSEVGNPELLLHNAVDAIANGHCDTVAIVYGNASRASGLTAYGGIEPSASAMYMSLRYYHPWGFSSPTAQYAMALQDYLQRFGKEEKDLAPVPIAFRKHATRNDNAVMRDPLSLDSYLAARYIVRPLRVLDCCLVNDGGVCLILRREELSRDLRHVPVTIAGTGRWSPYARHTQMPYRMLEPTWNNVARSAADCFDMAAMTPADVDFLQCYDGYSFQLPVALEGLGFCAYGEGLDFIAGGRIEVGGELPCNTSGGMLSESYVHGMNHQVETVRQLRHDADGRQVAGATSALYVHHGHWGAMSVLYQRGGR